MLEKASRWQFLLSLVGAGMLAMGVGACGPSDADTGGMDAGMGDALMCSDVQAQCGGQCVDLQSNSMHCGECGNTCRGGSYCNSGTCECIKQDAKKCGVSCVDLQTNRNHCGKCGNACDPGSKCESGTCKQMTVIEKVIEETNEVRSTQTDCGEYGVKSAVPPVQGDPELHEAALMHSERMEEYQFFAHDDPRNGTNFADRIEMTDYSGAPVAENIARGQRSAEQVVQGWKESDGHCKNMMLMQANEMGVGYVEGRSGPYWTQVFGAE